MLTSLCPDGQDLLITDCQASDFVEGKFAQPCGGGICAKARSILSRIDNGVAPYSRSCMMVATRIRALSQVLWRLVRVVGLLRAVHLGGASGDRSRRLHVHRQVSPWSWKLRGFRGRSLYVQPAFWTSWTH